MAEFKKVSSTTSDQASSSQTATLTSGKLPRVPQYDNRLQTKYPFADRSKISISDQICNSSVENHRSNSSPRSLGKKSELHHADKNYPYEIISIDCSSESEGESYPLNPSSCKKIGENSNCLECSSKDEQIKAYSHLSYQIGEKLDEFIQEKLLLAKNSFVKKQSVLLPTEEEPEIQSSPLQNVTEKLFDSFNNDSNGSSEHLGISENNGFYCLAGLDANGKTENFQQEEVESPHVENTAASDLSGFQIDEDVIDRAPRKSIYKFVSYVMDRIYTQNYLRTHKLLPMKYSRLPMDESEVNAIIETALKCNLRNRKGRKADKEMIRAEIKRKLYTSRPQ